MRRRRGSMLLTIAGMFTIIAVLLTCWVGQDLQIFPGPRPPHDLLFPGRLWHRARHAARPASTSAAALPKSH